MQALCLAGTYLNGTNMQINDEAKVVGIHKLTFRDEETGKITRQFTIKNLVPTVGREVLARRLSGNITYTGAINYCALGTGTTPAANGDTTLDTETYRKVIASATFLNNVAFISAFFSAAEVSGTFEELGYFIDGTATVDTGQLFSRFLATITKSLTETLTIDSEITFV